jgi:hypothetical protein
LRSIGGLVREKKARFLMWAGLVERTFPPFVFVEEAAGPVERTGQREDDLATRDRIFVIQRIREIGEMWLYELLGCKY